MTVIRYTVGANMPWLWENLTDVYYTMENDCPSKTCYYGCHRWDTRWLPSPGIWPCSRVRAVRLFCYFALFCFTLISILLVFLCIWIVLYSDSSSELVPLGLLLYCIINNIYLICNAFNIPKLENKEDYKWKVLIMSCKI